MARNPAMSVHYLGVECSWMASPDFGLFAGYEARVGASGGFRYQLGSAAGDVENFAQAQLRGMPERNVITLGIVL
jgi:hypothetical protein